MNIMFMGSSEIAEVTNKKKGHVHRDIKNMLEQLYNICIPSGEKLNFEKLKILSSKITIVYDSRKYITEFWLDKEHTLILLTNYNINIRKSVVKSFLKSKNYSKKDLLSFLQRD